MTNTYYRGNMPQLELTFDTTKIMLLTIQQKELLQALSVCYRAVPAKGVIPILEYFRFEINSGDIKITGSNQEIFISKSVSCISDIKELDVCFNANKLLTYVKGLDDQPLVFTITKKDIKTISCEIKTSTGKLKLPLLNGDDYLKIPDADDVSIEIPSQDLLSAFERTTFAVDPSPTKIISNVLIKFGNGIQVTGANPFYMSTAKAYDGTVNLKEILIQRNALDILTSFNETGKLTVSYSDSNIKFITESGITLVAATREGRYPEIKGMLQINCDKHIVVDTAQFKSAFNRVAYFTDLLVKRVVLFLSPGKITLSSANEMDESANEELTCNYDGDQIDIGVISSQMIAVLSKIRSDNMYISLSNERSPILIKEDETDSLDNVFLIIPSVING